MVEQMKEMSSKVNGVNWEWDFLAHHLSDCTVQGYLEPMGFVTVVQAFSSASLLSNLTAYRAVGKKITYTSISDKP